MKLSRLIPWVALATSAASLLAAAPASNAPATAPASQPAVAVSRVSAKYAVDANIPYAPHPTTLLDMLYPKGMIKSDAALNTPDKQFPGVIMFHGGGWIRTDKATMSSFYNRFLDHGFVVCNVEYRMAGRDAAGKPTPDAAPAPAAVEDALAAAKWFYDHAGIYNVDQKRIVVTGASAGGHLALMVGMATPDAHLGPTAPGDFKIAAIVNGYGPPDVPDLLQRRTSWAVQWLPADTPDRDALAKRVSPITYVRKDLPPILTVQGSRDTTVPIEQNQRLTKALQDAGVDAQMHLVEGAGHGFTTPAAAWPDAEKTIFDWLAKKKIIAPAATQPH